MDATRWLLTIFGTVLAAFVGAVAYWAKRTDARIDGLRARHDALPDTYARRDDVALTRAELREELRKINEKLDRLIERGGR